MWRLFCHYILVCRPTRTAQLFERFQLWGNARLKSSWLAVPRRLQRQQHRPADCCTTCNLEQLSPALQSRPALHILDRSLYQLSRIRLLAGLCTESWGQPAVSPASPAASPSPYTCSPPAWAPADHQYTSSLDQSFPCSNHHNCSLKYLPAGIFTSHTRPGQLRSILVTLLLNNLWLVSDYRSIFTIACSQPWDELFLHCSPSVGCCTQRTILLLFWCSYQLILEVSGVLWSW